MTIPTERVRELLKDATYEYDSARRGEDDVAAAFWGPLKDVLTAELTRRDAEAREGWVSVDESRPEKGELVLVWLDDEHSERIAISAWIDYHEAPVPFSSATICTGEGWADFDYEEVTHWRPLPPPPVPNVTGEK